MGLRFGIPIEDGQLGPRAFPNPGKGSGVVRAPQKPQVTGDQFRVLATKGEDLFVKGMEDGVEIEIVIPFRLAGRADFLGFKL